MTLILFYFFKILNNDRTSKRKKKKRSDKCNGGNPHTECCGYDKSIEIMHKSPTKQNDNEGRQDTYIQLFIFSQIYRVAPKC